MRVITTPTGQIGRQILARPLAADEPIRVIVRDASRLDPEVRERVEVVAAPTTTRACWTGRCVPQLSLADLASAVTQRGAGEGVARDMRWSAPSFRAWYEPALRPAVLRHGTG